MFPEVFLHNPLRHYVMAACIWVKILDQTNDNIVCLLEIPYVVHLEKPYKSTR